MNEATPTTISFEEVTDLLQKLVRINTSNPPGQEEPAAQLLADFMEGAGFEVGLQRFAPGRANLIARWRGTGQRPALMLNGHLDTVLATEGDWKYPPHSATIDGGTLYGRGALDMKGGVTAMVMGCVALARAGVKLAGDVVFAGTAGEEVDCRGARELVNEDLGAIGGLVVGEPTRLEVVSAHRGALWLEITTTGKAAHGSMPDQGYNAILAMHRVIDCLLGYRSNCVPHPLLAPPTMNLGTIEGGVKTNIVADRCTLTVDLRTVPGQEHASVVQDIQGIVDSLGKDDPAFRASVRVANDRPAVETPTEDRLIQDALDVGGELFHHSLTPIGKGYYTDASVLTPGLDVPTLIFGPGDERLAHQVNERIELKDVHLAARFYMKLARKFLSPSTPV